MKTGMNRALELIEECIMTKATFLDLGNLKLTEVPEEVKELDWVERLNLGWYYVDENGKTQFGQNKIGGSNLNELRDISILKELTGLTTLYLSSNQITDISFLKELTGLTTLDLSSNQITDYTFLKELTGLTSLNLRSNQITDISILKELTGLTRLYLSSNQITDYSILKELTGLTTLDLSSNQITDISILKELTGLTTLDLRSNQLTDISILKELTGLTALDLSYNQLTDISILKELTGLTTLDLRSNQLTDISILKELTGLTTLDLSSNQITDIRNLLPIIRNFKEIDLEIGYLAYVTISLKDNPIVNPPIEIIKQGKAAIINYFEQIDRQGGTEPLFEAKVLIVGEAGAGKTSLLRKLTEADYEIPKGGREEKETVGANVFEGWKFPYAKNKAIEFSANIWDFGGQSIQYMTHQFFLTSQSLYVLMADDRKESAKFPYWFEVIKLLGEDEEKQCSPVLVVLNERLKSETGFHFDERQYKRKYPEINIRTLDVDFSNEEDGRMDMVKQEIQRLVSDLPHIGIELPRQWRFIREELQRIKKETPHISLDRFRAICAEKQVDREDDQNLISTYLHRLGYLIHFQKDMLLRNFIILDSTWALKAIYTLLTHKTVKENQGRFDTAKIDELWSNYNADEKSKLLNLMMRHRFDLIFEVQESPGNFITPLLLPDVQPKYDWENEGCLRFRYDYTFMPEGILTRLIVRKSMAIHVENGENLVWKNGVVLNYKGCQVQIIEDPFPQPRIDIEIIGNELERKNALAWVRGEVAAVHDWFNDNVEVEENVPCNCSHCSKGTTIHFFDYETLAKRMQKGRAEYCKISDEEISPQALLEGVFGAAIVREGMRGTARRGEVDEITMKGEGVAVLKSLLDKQARSKAPYEPSQRKEVTPPEVTPKKKFYEQWWFGYATGSLVGGLFIGLLLWRLLKWNYFDGLLIGFSGLAAILFFSGNPARRHYRSAKYALASAVSLTVINLEGSFDIFGLEKDSGFKLSLDLISEYDWLIALALIVLAAYLFWLDSKMKE